MADVVIALADPETWSFASKEADQRSTAARDIPQLQAARMSAALLAQAVWLMSDMDAVGPDAPGPVLRRVALLNVGSLAIRTANATCLLVSSGYEPDTHSLKRRLTELWARATHLYDDQSGEQARRWLRGEGHVRASKLVHKYLGSQGAAGQALLSRYTHDDSLGIRLLASPPLSRATSEREHLVNVLPSRNHRQAAAILLETTRDVADIAMMITVAGGAALELPDEVAAALHEHAAASRNQTFST